MIELREETFINVPPEIVWNWLENLPCHYKAWHADHIGCRWLRGSSLEIGTEMEFTEVLHGKTHRVRAKLTGVEQGQCINYRIFPGLEGRFEVARAGSGAVFIAVIQIGVKTPSLGELTDWFLAFLLRSRIKEFARHQAEEGRNLKRLLEGEVGSTGDPE